MPPDVTTRSFGNQRDGANLHETVMTIDRLQKQGIRLKYAVDLPGDARGAEAQPLVCYGLTMRDGLKHDVCFVVTMGGDALAFDLADGRILWKHHIARPVKSTAKLDMWQVSDGWSFLSTPVINRNSNTMYAVGMSSQTGRVEDAHFRLYVLSLTDGSDQTPPLDLNDATYKPPGLDKTFHLGSVPRKQRPGLLFDSRDGADTVFVAFGSFFESADTNQGWVVAVDVTGVGKLPNIHPSIAASWTTTAKGSGGGIWMAGQGLSMDTDGFLYGMNGNGDLDGVYDLCECFFKLRYTPRFAGAPAKLEHADHFCPFMDSQRVKGAEKPRPPNATSNYRDADDQDLGSGGALLLLRSLTGFSHDLVAGAGKDGVLYLVLTDDMGNTMPRDLQPDRIREHVYGKLACPPYGLTFDGSNMDLAPTDPGDLQTLVNNYTVHQHSTPVVFQSPDHGLILYTNGENGPVRAFSVWEKNDKIGITYLGCGAQIASAGMPAPGGMPGGAMTLSANGKNDGILWNAQPIDGDANRDVVRGRITGYAASWFRNGAMVPLWSSQDWGVEFAYNKFCPPIETGGRVIYPTYDARVLVFELTGT